MPSSKIPSSFVLDVAVVSCLWEANLVVLHVHICTLGTAVFACYKTVGSPYCNKISLCFYLYLTHVPYFYVAALINNTEAVPYI